MRRGFWVWLHRWAGLVMAAPLIVVGLTGALLAFYPELQRAITPHWYPGRDPASWLTAGELAARLEAAEPRLRVGQMLLQGFDGTTQAWIVPRTDPATGQPYVLAYDNVIVDPASGAVLDHARWGGIADGWRNLMSFVYELHYALALGMTGVWVLGVCALLWTLDSFVGLYLTLPALRRAPEGGGGRKTWLARWAPAWRPRWRAGGTKLNFDLHRAGGLWLWAALLVFGWSSVGMNLWDTAYTWSMRAVSDYRPPWVLFQPLERPLETPRIGWVEADARGRALLDEAVRKRGGQVLRPVGVRYYPEHGVYQVQVQTDREIDDRPRRYSTQVYIDAETGTARAWLFPSGQYPGNTVSNWLYALHMANVFGLPYRIFVCILGLAIVMLSVTGVIIWLKKRSARRTMHRRLVQTQPGDPSVALPRRATRLRERRGT